MVDEHYNMPLFFYIHLVVRQSSKYSNAEESISKSFHLGWGSLHRERAKIHFVNVYTSNTKLERQNHCHEIRLFYIKRNCSYLTILLTWAEGSRQNKSISKLFRLDWGCLHRERACKCLIPQIRSCTIDIQNHSHEIRLFSLKRNLSLLTTLLTLLSDWTSRKSHKISSLCLLLNIYFTTNYLIKTGIPISTGHHWSYQDLPTNEDKNPCLNCSL